MSNFQTHFRSSKGDEHINRIGDEIISQIRRSKVFGLRISPATGGEFIFTHQTVALDIVRRPKATAVHELERYMRCKDCSQVRGYTYKRCHLVALRITKITASDPPSTWWPGER